MTKRSRSVSLADFKARFPTEAHVRQHIADVRFGSPFACPNCNFLSQNRPFVRGLRVYCPGCDASFSLIDGTAFANTKLPLSLWFYLMLIIGNEVRTLPMNFIARHLGVSRRAAFRMHACIRLHLEAIISGRVLGGPGQFVEIDETWISSIKPSRGEAGSGAIVFGIYSKQGVITKVVESRSSECLIPVILEHVHPETVFVTDGLRTYRALARLGLKHIVLDHSRGEFTNAEGFSSVGIEGYWANLKYSITSNNVTPERTNLNTYLAEHAFHYNCRKQGKAPFLEMISRFPRVNLKKLPVSARNIKM